MNDDWNDSDDEVHTHIREWKRVENSIGNQGYREGLEMSQEEMMQGGFNEGFRKALLMALEAGCLQGGICASLSRNPAKQSGSDSSEGDNFLSEKRDSLQNINNDVTSLVSQIPSFICGRGKSCGDNGGDCSCSSGETSSNLVADSSQSFWSQLSVVNSKAEKTDEILDSSFSSVLKK